MGRDSHPIMEGPYRAPRGLYNNQEGARAAGERNIK